MFSELGYTHLTLQIGKGDFEPSASDSTALTTTVYQYKPSIVEDIKSADLVISHAGKVHWRSKLCPLTICVSRKLS